MTTEALDIKEKLGIVPRRKRWIRLLRWVAILLVAGAGFNYWLSRQKALAARPTTRYRTETARTGDLTVTVTATGQLKPTRTVDIGSQVSGIIDQVLVNYNDTVNDGQVLARINTEKLDAQVAQDKAQLQSARAKVRGREGDGGCRRVKIQALLDADQRSKGQLVSQQDVDNGQSRLRTGQGGRDHGPDDGDAGGSEAEDGQDQRGFQSGHQVAGERRPCWPAVWSPARPSPPRSP